MTHKSNVTRTLHMLTMAVVVVLASGSLTLALEGDEPVEELTPQSTAELAPPSAEQQVCGGCRGRNRASDAGEPGCLRQGRGSGQEDGMGRRQGRGRGRGQGMGPGPGRSSGRRGNNQDVMEATRALVHEYRQDIVREIEDVPNGVATTTRSPGNPEAVEVLQRHVYEMKGLLEDGGRIRVWDPLFSEIFDHYDEIEMVVETLDDGIRVVETSANPEVAKLIRAHARKVNEFVARGPTAVHETTALPDGYQTGE